MVKLVASSKFIECLQTPVLTPDFSLFWPVAPGSLPSNCMRNEFATSAIAFSLKSF